MKTQSRRDFLRISAAGAAGAFVLSGKNSPLLSTMQGTMGDKASNVALQLYTIREDMQKDVKGSLKKVADIGYKLLELADYNNGKFYGYTPSDFRKLVNDMGMKVLSSHINVSSSASGNDDIQKIADDHVAVGAIYCIQPWVEPKDRNIDFFQKLVSRLNDAGMKMKKSGIKYGYHNHNFEFKSIDGKIPYFDILLPGLDRNYVTMEIDLFWTTKAGQDPVAIFKKYPGRFELWHMKDAWTKQPPIFDTTEAKDFAPVGAGVIDFKRIIAARDIAGMKYMIVEQDESRDKKPFDDIKTSFVNLTTKLLA